MSLEELDNLIKTMEGSINEIKNYQVVYKELSNLQGDISKSIENLQANKQAIDKLNSDITISVEKLKKQIEQLNTILPKKMLEIVSSNKDVQLDIKTKHEELVKLSNKNTTKVFEFMQKLSTKHIILSVLIAITFVLNLVDFVTNFIK